MSKIKGPPGPTYIIPLLYHHRHGTDIVLFKTTNPRAKLPEVTNELLNGVLAMDCAELEREDEWTEWMPVRPLKDMMELT